MKVSEGDKIVSCGTTSGFHRNGNYWAPKVYEARVRKKDKTLVWKLSSVAKDHEIAVPGWDVTPAALRVARAYARDMNYPFVANIKDNTPVAQTKTPRKKPTTRKVKTASGVVEEPVLVGRFRLLEKDDVI